VWTGPDSDVDTSRFTSQVIIDLIGEARRSLLLASYATNPEARIVAALTEAVDRGVDVSILYERAADNPAFRSGSDAFAGLRARRLIWPADRRPAGAALHPKFVVVDDHVALVGSANLTGRALDVNMECGMLIRGGRHPRAIADHIWSLLHSGELTAIPGGPGVG
jgi:phosphatidylserine/phosphatidylglycerophosphate/cardiolipin synthase-like enzyme